MFARLMLIALIVVAVLTGTEACGGFAPTLLPFADKFLMIFAGAACTLTTLALSLARHQ